MDQAQHDGTEAGTAAMLYAGAVIGVLLRGGTWVLSAFLVGPLLGLADTLGGTLGDHRSVLFGQAAITVLAVLAAIVCGIGLQTDPGHYRLPVRLLCTLFLLDVLIYLVPVVLATALPFVEFSTAAWALFGVTVVGNLALGGLALLIIVRTRRPGREVPVPAEAVTVS